MEFHFEKNPNPLELTIQRIDKEDELIHKRFTSLLTTNGFLFAATGLIFSRYNTFDQAELWMPFALLTFVAIVGIVANIASRKAIKAAEGQLQYLFSHWHCLLARLDGFEVDCTNQNEQFEYVSMIYPRPFGNAENRKKGHNLTTYLPGTIATIWILFGVVTFLKAWSSFNVCDFLQFLFSVQKEYGVVL